MSYTSRTNIAFKRAIRNLPICIAIHGLPKPVLLLEARVEMARRDATRMVAFGHSSSSSQSDQISARWVPVDWPRDAEEKSDQNEKLSERSEFFSFRYFLSIAGSEPAPAKAGDNRRGRLLWVTFLGEARKVTAPRHERDRGRRRCVSFALRAGYAPDPRLRRG